MGSQRSVLVLALCSLSGCDHLHRMNSTPVNHGQVTAANPSWAPSTAPVTVHMDGIDVASVADALTAKLATDGWRVGSTNDYQVVYEKNAPANVPLAPDPNCGALTAPAYWITAIFTADSLGTAVTASRDLIRNPGTECMARTPAPTAEVEKLLQSLKYNMKGR